MGLASRLLLPVVLLTGVAFVYPILLAVSVAVRDGRGMDLDTLGRLPISATQFAKVFGSGEALESLAVSFVYTAGTLVPCFFVGLATALLLNEKLPLRRFFRVVFLLPWAMPGVIAGIAFLWLLDPTYGVVNYLLRSLGLISRGIPWFFDPHTAMAAVIVPTVWTSYPFLTLVLLAALQGIPRELYEAARVDGAGAVACFRSITLPGIRSSAVLGLAMVGLWTFRSFDVIYPITKGGPVRATETLAIAVYNEAFRFFHLPYAAALGLIGMGISVAVLWALFPQIKRQFF